MAEANEMDNEEEAVLEAESVFVLMSQRFRLSRNARAQWYLFFLHFSCIFLRIFGQNSKNLKYQDGKT